MKSRLKALPISFYATLMAVLVTGAFILFGSITFSEFQRVRQDLESTNRIAAQSELDAVLEQTLADAERVVSDFARWDEVQQQLLVPQYYSYWRNHRMLNSDVLPANTVDAEIYSANGSTLALRDDAKLPASLVVPLPPAYVRIIDGQPYLKIFHAVPDKVNPMIIRGYVAVLLAFAGDLTERHAYRYLNSSTLSFDLPDTESMTWSAFEESITFTLRPNPMAAAVEEILTTSVVQLTILFGVFTFLMIPAIIWLIVRPLRALTVHIDRMKETSGALLLEHLGGAVPIAETEKIRESLNEYQSRLEDVHSSLEEKSQELWLLAHHDPLTGAQNRRAFDEYLQNMPRLHSERQLGICFALFDVNHFKAINDTYGHQVGDEVLKLIAGQVDSVLRRGEELFRIGGDEFAAVLVDCDEGGAYRIAERCQERIAKMDFARLGMREPIKVSIGLAMAVSSEPEALDTLHWKADVAMYHAKRPGHSNIAVFREDMAEHGEGLFTSWANNAIFEAITGGTGLTMFYQPVVDLGSGTIAYYESLVRIRHEGEWVMPSMIFPLVEARRLDLDLDKAIFKQVLHDLQHGRIDPGAGVSINLSGPTVVNDRLPQWLQDFRPYLKDYRIVLEVTETALITQMGVANENLSTLRAQGFEIALDDFGSGYSSFRYLATMPVDTVKFDISLIRCLEDTSQRRIVEHLTQMINEAGYKLVAEGVETENTLKDVADVGFDFAQGYYFGRPEAIPVKETRSLGEIIPFPSRTTRPLR